MNVPCLVLVVDSDQTVGSALVAALEHELDGVAEARLAGNEADALALSREITAAGGFVPVAFVERSLGREQGVDLLVSLHHDPEFKTTRKVLVTSRASLHDVDEALKLGAVHGIITRPWTALGLGRQLRAQLATYLVENAPDHLDRFAHILDTEDLDHARSRVEQRRAVPLPDPNRGHALLELELDTDELEFQLVEAIDRSLGHPPRLRVGPDTILIEEGDDIGGIYVILDGTVQLSSRTETGERILHERSTGAIVGLLSLASHRRAMLQCRTTTDVRAIPVTLDQLAMAMERDPDVSGLLTRVLIRSLARRLRRSDELQVELDQSLAALTEARAQLVSSARFATLGEMAAGMAHELNNPTAALTRAVDHLAEDVAAIVDDEATAAALERSLTADPPPAAQTRSLRRSLADSLDDRRLADRLIDLGVTTTNEAEALVAAGPTELAKVEAAARLARSLRSATGAAERITSLVASLRAYARGADGRGPLLNDVDVAEGVDNALHLVSHRLGDITVERRYESVPPIAARPGALQQVWTNLFANAIDAMGDAGVLTVSIVPAEADRISVLVADNGPGISDDTLAHIFEPHFTTKRGRVEFGLGLGLSIAAQIVEEHNGSIHVQSRPGETLFTVELPVGDRS